MKKAAEIFLIIGIIWHILMIAAGFFYNHIYSLWGAVGIIFTSLTLKRLCKAQKASDIPLAYIIFALLFGVHIAGILLLCMQDEDFKQAAEPVGERQSAVMESAKADTEADSLETLIRYKELLDAGEITQEEYEGKKESLLS
ncbi:MAG: SHOCT domain-containing protein [Christensenellales bacterium]